MLLGKRCWWGESVVRVVYVGRIEIMWGKGRNRSRIGCGMRAFRSLFLLVLEFGDMLVSRFRGCLGLGGRWEGGMMRKSWVLGDGGVVYLVVWLLIGLMLGWFGTGLRDSSGVNWARIRSGQRLDMCMYEEKWTSPKHTFRSLFPDHSLQYEIHCFTRHLSSEHHYDFDLSCGPHQTGVYHT